MSMASGGQPPNAASSIHRVTINGVDVTGSVSSVNLVRAASSGTEVVDAAKPMCEYRGHRIGGELVHYLDGQIVGRCNDCDARVVIDWFPGGTSVARVKGQVAEIMGAAELTEGMVENFHRAVELLEEDAEAIEDARDLVKITKQVVARRLREE